MELMVGTEEWFSPELFRRKGKGGALKKFTAILLKGGTSTVAVLARVFGRFEPSFHACISTEFEYFGISRNFETSTVLQNPYCTIIPSQ